MAQGAPYFQPGDWVNALFAETQEWYPAQIVDMVNAGLYTIAWEDGTKTDTAKWTNDLQPFPPADGVAGEDAVKNGPSLRSAQPQGPSSSPDLAVERLKKELKKLEVSLKGAEKLYDAPRIAKIKENIKNTKEALRQAMGQAPMEKKKKERAAKTLQKWVRAKSMKIQDFNRNLRGDWQDVQKKVEKQGVRQDGCQVFISNLLEDAYDAVGGYKSAGDWEGRPSFKHKDKNIFLYWKNGYWILSYTLGADQPRILECVDERGHEQMSSLMPPQTTNQDPGDWVVVEGKGQPEVKVPRAAIAADAALGAKAWVERNAKALPENFTIKHAEADSWKRYVDKSGKEYWYNYVSRKTQWEKPTGFDPNRKLKDIKYVEHAHRHHDRQPGEESLAEQRKRQAATPVKLTGKEDHFAQFFRGVVQEKQDWCTICNEERKIKRAMMYCLTCRRAVCPPCQEIFKKCPHCIGDDARKSNEWRGNADAGLQDQDAAQGYPQGGLSRGQSRNGDAFEVSGTVEKEGTDCISQAIEEQFKKSPVRSLQADRPFRRCSRCSEETKVGRFMRFCVDCDFALCLDCYDQTSTGNQHALEAHPGRPKAARRH